jgi:hypothetical protein
VLLPPGLSYLHLTTRDAAGNLWQNHSAILNLEKGLTKWRREVITWGYDQTIPSTTVLQSEPGSMGKAA